MYIVIGDYALKSEEELYSSYQQFKGWHADVFGQFRPHEAAYFSFSCSKAARCDAERSEKSQRLLEIGFGNGAFLGWAREQGYEVYGVELQPHCLAAARAAGFTACESLVELKQLLGLRLCDGVVMFDVLEHIPTNGLLQFMKEIRQVMRPGGWVALRFPNGDSPFGRLNQHGDLTHGCTLGSVAIQQLAEMTGFRIHTIACQPFPIAGNTWVRALTHICLMGLRAIFELPIQALMNLYYPGKLAWFPLHPNLAVWLIADVEP